MSTFKVSVTRIRAIEPHPNADAIELAVIDGYRSIVQLGQVKVGDPVVYIPESAVLPEWLLKSLGFWDTDKGQGRLAGTRGNRVKAIMLRGVLSQGICLPVRTDHASGALILVTGLEPGCQAVVTEGDDVASLLGIVKYEPPIPVAMAGEVFCAGYELTLGFDVENWKSHPGVLKEDEDVVFTEKLHGTCTIVAVLPYSHAHPEAFGERQNILIFSKGLGATGLVFKNNANNQRNLYVRATRDLVKNIDQVLSESDLEEGVSTPTFILGETYGPGVQDLAYGKAIGFRVFAVAAGYRGRQRYLDWDDVEGVFALHYGFETVPVLYRGPFSEEVMRKHTSGKTELGAGHIREGIVMVPATERFDLSIGRVCLKSVSADYLVRKGGTEYS